MYLLYRSILSEFTTEVLRSDTDFQVLDEISPRYPRGIPEVSGRSGAGRDKLGQILQIFIDFK